MRVEERTDREAQSKKKRKKKRQDQINEIIIMCLKPSCSRQGLKLPMLRPVFI